MQTATTSFDILLVEDDQADALLIEGALLERGSGRSVTQVADGVAALERLRDPERARPDLIVMDLNMPRMNGRELLAILKADQELRVIPVVVLTTSNAPDDVVGAYSRYANAYITKPIDLDGFVAAVRNMDTFFHDTATKVPRPPASS
ncbi:MAG TPA: response regulator [Actinospica sp.]|jgi:CheY-like chemotaxis protein|nr:response regulator [Actinospica sp.]